MKKRVFIVAAKRTPIGKMGGSLAQFTPADLAAVVIQDIIKSTGIDPKQIDEVIGGNVLSGGQGQGVIRQASIKGGVPAEVPAYSINMVCGSGLIEVMNGYNDILVGDAELVLAGGTEVMSNAGFVLPGTVRSGIKMGNISAIDHMVNDGLTDAFNNYHMGITAENIAEKYNISREAQDEFAIQSQTKAIAAVDGGKFVDEITPVEIVTRKETIIFKDDEYPNRTTSLEKLAKLRPAFKKEGTVTAGNASGINDGASFVLLASEEKMKELGLTPIAEVIAVGQGGVDPAIMGMDLFRYPRSIEKANLKLSDIELLELNEAFAAQSLVLSVNSLTNTVFLVSGLPKEPIFGRSDCIRSPIGASGNRILTTLVHGLIREKKTMGLASLCIGGGMGTAIIVKRV